MDLLHCCEQVYKAISIYFYHIRHCLFFPACCCADALWLYLNFLHSNAVLCSSYLCSSALAKLASPLQMCNAGGMMRCSTPGRPLICSNLFVSRMSELRLFTSLQIYTHIFASFSKASGHVIGENEQESKFCLCFWRKELSFVHFQCKDWHSL